MSLFNSRERGTGMRRVHILIALAAIMAVGFVLPAYAGGPTHRVSVGGADSTAVPKPGDDANFSLTAMVKKDGTVSGQWQDSFGHGNGGVHVKILCLVVDGDDAWVSGVITKASGIAEGSEGTGARTRVHDGGKSGDQISFTFFGGDPATACEAKPLLGLFDTHNGQVKVK